MAPKRRTRAGNADTARLLKRAKVDATDYSSWGWVGTEAHEPRDITHEHVLAASGLAAVNQHGFHPSLYSGVQNGTDESSVIVVEDTTCDKKMCRKNPLCTAFLGQARWDDHAAAKKSFLKHCDLGDNPSDTLRDKQTPVGLENLGATCYANAFLQVWFRNTHFRRGVYQCQALPTAAHTFSGSPIFHLQVTFAALERCKQRTFNPIKLVESLKLRASEQQDAQEFSKLFLTHLESEFSRQANPDLRSLISHQFEGKQTYATVCHSCQQRSTRAASFFELELSLEPDTRLEDRIASVLASEVLNGNNQYLCGNCEALNDATRSMELAELPPVLHISLLRFVFDPTTLARKKCKHKVSFPEVIDMKPFMGRPDTISEDTPKQLYRLSGVLLHKGASAYHGHYETEIDVGNSTWMSFNDETVTNIKNPFGIRKKGDETPKRMQSKDAYMLVYSRVSESNSSLLADVGPPSAAMTEVVKLNDALDEEIKKYQDQERLALSRLENTRDMIVGAYRSWVPTEASHNDLIVVSRQALEELLSRPFNPGGEELHETPFLLSNKDIICTHGKLDPRKSTDMKCIRNFTLPEKYGFDSPPNIVNDVCEDCVRHEFIERLYSQQHPLHVKQLDEACDEEVVDVDSGCWISKAWLKDWKLQKPKLHAAGQGDVPPDHVDFVRDVLCEHGGLAYDQSRRQHLSAGATQLLQDLFLSWTPVNLEDLCSVCEALAHEARDNLQAERGQATLEKSQLKHIIDAALEETALFLEGVHYAIILKDFARQWRKWAARPALTERPHGADMSALMCKHEGLAVDLNVPTDWTDTFVVVKVEDWKKISQHYSLVQMISAVQSAKDDGTGSHWKTEPLVCHECRIQRKSSYQETQISVRVIHAPPANDAAPSATNGSSVAKFLAPRIRRGPQVKRVTITPSTQVKDVKLQLQKELNVSPIAQRLFYKGSELHENSATMASLGVLMNDEIDVHIVKENASLFDDDIEIVGERVEGPGFEGTLLGHASDHHTPGSSADEGMVDSAGLSCVACTFSNTLDADACVMCATLLG